MARWGWGCSFIVIFVLVLAGEAARLVPGDADLAGDGNVPKEKTIAAARLVPGAADLTADGSVPKEKTITVHARASHAVVAGDAKNFIAFGGVGGAAGVGGVAGMGGGLLPGFSGGIGKYGGIGAGAGIGGISGVIPVGGGGGFPVVLPGGLPGRSPTFPVPGSHGGLSPGSGTGSGGLPQP